MQGAPSSSLKSNRLLLATPFPAQRARPSRTGAVRVQAKKGSQLCPLQNFPGFQLSPPLRQTARAFEQAAMALEEQ